MEINSKRDPLRSPSHAFMLRQLVCRMKIHVFPVHYHQLSNGLFLRIPLPAAAPFSMNLINLSFAVAKRYRMRINLWPRKGGGEKNLRVTIRCN